MCGEASSAAGSIAVGLLCQRAERPAQRVEIGLVVFPAADFTACERVTDGGRVLAVTALGDTISAAKFQAYKAVKCIRWDGAWCRKDISDTAIE